MPYALAPSSTPPWRPHRCDQSFDCGKRLCGSTIDSLLSSSFDLPPPFAGREIECYCAGDFLDPVELVCREDVGVFFPAGHDQFAHLLPGVFFDLRWGRTLSSSLVRVTDRGVTVVDRFLKIKDFSLPNVAEARTNVVLDRLVAVDRDGTAFVWEGKFWEVVRADGPVRADRWDTDGVWTADDVWCSVVREPDSLLNLCAEAVRGSSDRLPLRRLPAELAELVGM